VSYVTLALCAYALFALTNVVDKVVLGPRRVDPIGYLLASAIWSPLALVLIPWAKLTPPGAPRVVAGLAAGACFFLMLVAYFNAAQREEITRVAPLWEMAPIFAWILARLTLDERLSATGGIAFALLIFGGLLLSARRPRDLLVPSTALLLMIPATALWAAHNVLAGVLLRGYDPLAGYLIVRCGMLLMAAASLAVPRARRGLRETLRQPAGTHLLIGFTVVLSIFGFVLLMHAIQRGPVSIVTALGGSAGLFVLGYVAILNFFRPGWIEETGTRGVIAQKITGTLLLALGIGLLRS
jgi:drug/metabolite transporter (DMT)-like permease